MNIHDEDMTIETCR